MTGRASGRRLAAARIAAVLGLAAIALTACGAAGTQSGARPVTTDESQLLAIARFTNFDAGTRAVNVSFDDAGFALRLDGYVDYRSGVGYAALLDGEQPNSLVLWQEHSLFVHAPAAGLPLPPPDLHASTAAEWGAGALDPTASTLHAVLILLTELGNDRPDNPLLLQQGGAQWLREDTVGDVDVTVFTGPTTTDEGGQAEQARVRYWVAADGTLMRAEAQLGIQWITIDFGPADGVTLESTPALDVA